MMKTSIVQRAAGKKPISMGKQYERHKKHFIPHCALMTVKATASRFPDLTGESTSLYAFLDLRTGAPDSEMTIRPITSIQDLRFSLSANGNA